VFSPISTYDWPLVIVWLEAIDMTGLCK
jgi:hypothetical protein